MAPTNSTKASKTKKEKVSHPQSRKAGQMERAQLRKSKLSEAAQKKSKLASSTIDKYVFFFHALPDEKDVLTLEELHALVKDVWLTRLDSQIEEERQARRKGRPKSTKEAKLEALKEAESEEYRTGMEVIDLTHPANVKLFRGWDQSALEYIDLLRFIRIISSDPTSVVVSRPGKHYSLKEPSSDPQTQDSAMQED